MRPGFNPHRILIRAANWVGDAVMTTPALRAIRKGYPAARITLLAKPWVSPIFRHNPNIDEILCYDANHRHRGLRGLNRLASELRHRRFDTAILFQNAFEAAFLAWLGGIEHRVGYTTDGRTLLLTERIRNWKPLKKGHLIDYYLGIAAAMGIAAENRKLDLFVSEKECRQAFERLGRLGLSPLTCLVGINPGAAHGSAKRWPLDRFAETAKKLLTRHNGFALIFGSPGEASLGRELQKAIGPKSYNLAGQTTLRQAIALIACCRLFITNDSGLMHVAAAMNTPQVVVIGPTDPMATGPANRSSRIVHNPGSCDRSPCLLAHCPIDHRCMRSIPVEKVVQAADGLMESIPQ